MATHTFHKHALQSEIVLKSKLMSVETGIRQVIFFVVLKFFVTSHFSWYVFQLFLLDACNAFL